MDIDSAVERMEANSQRTSEAVARLEEVVKAHITNNGIHHAIPCNEFRELNGRVTNVMLTSIAGLIAAIWALFLKGRI